MVLIYWNGKDQGNKSIFSCSKNKKCPTHVCTALITYKIDLEKCVGCTACARSYPVKAISGKVRETHTINQEACIKCGSCYDVCKFSAVIKD